MGPSDSRMWTEATRIFDDEAAVIWRDCIRDIENLAPVFGPDVDRVLHPGERYYRLEVYDVLVRRRTIGLGWCRRFTKAGHLFSFGWVLDAPARGRGLSIAAARTVINAVFLEYPQACALLAMAYSSNGSYKHWARRLRVVGEITEATPTGASLHIHELTRSTWRAYPWAHPGAVPVVVEPPAAASAPEPEQWGAPHCHQVKR